MVKQFRATTTSLSLIAATRAHPAKRPAITDEASPFALRSTRNRPRTAMHQWCVAGANEGGKGSGRVVADILGFRISGAMLGLVAAGPPRAVPDDGCGVM